MDLRRLQLSLVAAQLVGAATLLRSVAYDRWISVLAAALLIVGATAARRGRSWGVGLAMAAGAAFPVAWAIGIAPPWFCLVGIAGALPFAIASRAFARFDRGATILLASLAASAGAAGALAWKEYAWSIFMRFPITRPSFEPQHALLLMTLTTVMTALFVMDRIGHRGALAEGPRVRVGERLRVADSVQGDADAALELDDRANEDVSVEPAKLRNKLS